MKYKTKNEAINAAMKTIQELLSSDGYQYFSVKKDDEDVFIGLKNKGMCFAFDSQPKIEKDKIVWVRDDDDQDWIPAYATGRFTSDGWIICFPNGTTSVTRQHLAIPVHWKQYSLTNPALDSKPKIEKDQLVWVWDYANDLWLPRYATGRLIGNEIECWSGGTTSKTSNKITVSWNKYRLTDPKLDK